MLCREVVREQGVHNLKADDLIAEITSKGRGIIVNCNLMQRNILCASILVIRPINEIILQRMDTTESVSFLILGKYCEHKLNILQYDTDIHICGNYET
jgi:hypothetical protein